MSYRLTSTDAVIRVSDGTVIPADEQNHDYQAFLAWLGQGNVPLAVPALSTEATLAQYTAGLDTHMDSIARTRRYDNRLSCSLRAGYAGPFQAEGLAFALWMDSCNVLGYQILAEVQAGTRAMPTIEEFLQLLPAMVWPATAQ